LKNGATSANLAAIKTDNTTIKSSTADSSTSFAFHYLKLSPTDLSGLTQIKVRGLLNGAVVGSKLNMDGIRLYEVSASDYTAIGTTYTASTRPSIDDVWPYCDSVQHVTYPSVTKYGKNLLPPFSEWTLHANAVITEPYKLTLSATGPFSANYTSPISVVSGQSYTISIGTKDSSSRLIVWKGITRITAAVVGTSNSLSFTVDSTYNGYIIVELDNGAGGAGTYTFTNPMLNLGSTAEMFEPQNNDYIYGVTDSAGQPLKLASNVDGTVRDALYWRDGWYKLKRYRELTLDGSLTWSYYTDKVGHKGVQVTINGGVVNTSTTVKFDGKVLQRITSSFTSYDQEFYDGTTYQVMIPDTDSGWGETYTPSASEIQAYFYGWKMWDSTTGNSANPYNGTGTKAWVARNPDGSLNNGTTTTTTPTSQLFSGFTPYKLTYQLSTTQTEAVNVEGSITLHSGGNQIEVGEGVVVREKANPTSDPSPGTWVRINNSNVSSSGWLSKKVSTILKIYKNGVEDKKWTIRSGSDSGQANGVSWATIDKNDYDSTAEYTVTYLALDKYSLTSGLNTVSGEYWTNVGSVVAQNSKQISDIFPRLAAIRGLISPTPLLNMIISATGAAAAFLGLIKTVDGSGSGLDADVLRGLAPATAATANTIAQRDGSGGLTVASLSSGAIASSASVSATSGFSWNGTTMGQTRLNGTDLEYWNGSTWIKSSLVGVTSSLANPGYTKLANGMIIQMGATTTGTGAAGTTKTINFPLTFPTSGVAVMFNNLSASVQVFVQSSNASSFTIYYSTTISVDTTLQWFAIGY
jgi:hypothetical protein